MSSFILVKGMNRELTDDERKQIADWWEANPEKTLMEVANHWATELGIPVTQMAVARSVIQHAKPTSAPE